jgi:hypothetical protein
MILYFIFCILYFVFQANTGYEIPNIQFRILNIFELMEAPEGIHRQVKINEATVSLRNDGIVHVLFHHGITLDLALQMLLLNIYMEISGGEKRPFLFEAINSIKVTREARENALRIEEMAPGSAYAVLAETLTQQMLANFYLTVKRPKKPYRVFRQKEDAIKWLSGFIEQNTGGKNVQAAN